jgi:exodeoxyribonuclease (lambda-induced)
MNWQEQRLGKFTASEISKLFVRSKTDKNSLGQSAMTYVYTKVAEILTGEQTPEVNSNSIEYGRATEFEAFEWYKMTQPDAQYFGIAEPKFFEYGKFAGGSPDGFFGENGLLELKCPYNSAIHIQHLLISDNEDLKKFNIDYYAQVQANMIFCKKSIAHFVSYDPRMIDHRLRMNIVEVQPDEEMQSLIIESIDLAAKKVAITLELLNI